jgi:hypothetical protein
MALLPGTQRKHDYRTCRDPDCPRFPCRVYKEGKADGRGGGYAAGEAAGRAEGYAEGYAEGHADSGQ